MLEYDWQKHDRGHGFSVEFRRNEVHIPGPAYGGGIERRVAAGLIDAGRLGLHASIGVYIDAQHDLALDLLGVERGRVAERSVAVERDRLLVGFRERRRRGE